MTVLTTIKPDSYDEAADLCTFPVLYKLDSLGKLRTWRMQRQGSTYRTLAGLADGKQAVSGWTQAIGKQGRSDRIQAEAEVISQYKHQLDREYHETADTVGSPKMIEPMLAKTYDKWPGECMVQPKLDGIRCIADVNGLWTRQGQPITAVPHLHAALAPLFAIYPDAILDGELYNHDLRDDFGAISSIVRKKNPTVEDLEKAEAVMEYHIYDLVSGAGDFPKRKGELLSMFINADDIPHDGWFKLVPSRWAKTEEELRELYGKWTEEGYEGAMVRLPGFDYELGRRSKSLLKMKEFVTKEFRVSAVEEGNGNWAGAAKRMLLENDQGKVPSFGAGIRGSYAAGVQLLKDWNDNPEWWGKATATVRFFCLSPDLVPRFPVVIDFQPTGRID